MILSFYSGTFQPEVDEGCNEECSQGNLTKIANRKKVGDLIRKEKQPAKIGKIVRCLI